MKSAVPIALAAGGLGSNCKTKLGAPHVGFTCGLLGFLPSAFSGGWPRR
jgi:hypothetical protein